MAERGSRRQAASRQRHKQQPKRQLTGWRLWLRRSFIWGGALALLGFVFLALAVLFAARSLPSYEGLKASQTGQTIVVRARDGTEIVELGPSYGEWLPSSEIPEVMKDAMIAVEDRRYYSHPGVDPYGLARAIYVWITGDARLGARSAARQCADPRRYGRG